MIQFSPQRDEIGKNHGNEAKVVAIEVKSGKNVTHRSLDKFKAKYSDWMGEPCLLWDRDLKIDNGIAYLPLYMASLL